jgi:hypothetical protein
LPKTFGRVDCYIEQEFKNLVMKKCCRILYLLSLIAFFAISTIKADEPPNPGGGPGGGDVPVGGGSPLGGGLIALLTLSVGYTVKKIFDLRQK